MRPAACMMVDSLPGRIARGIRRAAPEYSAVPRRRGIVHGPPPGAGFKDVPRGPLWHTGTGALRAGPAFR